MLLINNNKIVHRIDPCGTLTNIKPRRRSKLFQLLTPTLYDVFTNNNNELLLSVVKLSKLN